ncbi:MAG TPA: DUF4395 domain-containing protein [Candidatus Deferrimicrobiaceae bacterium]|nr:DUF4395 domain-containing protein [Candidatus Deferrimicrobiaceae bacterium]
MSASSTTRLIDPRGHRFGGGLSATLLILAVVADAPLVVAAIALALGVSAFFGTQYSALGRPWPIVRRVLRIGPPTELEAEFPPRFAQALGTIGLTVGLALLAAGATTAGWLAVLAVAGLQTVLAVTGYCLGCRLYFLRWFLPALFDRIVRPRDGRIAAEARLR